MSGVWNLLKNFTMFLLFTFNSINCSENSETFDPDTYLLTNKIIKRQGYPSESHEITTEDGYILTMHRIPHGKQKTSSEKLPPVFLQHGLLGSSSNWVISGPESSLAYLLADKGHDVWLGNIRGNTYSRGHVSLSPNDRAFWNYSFHDVGTKDLATMIDYVLNITNQEKLYYIGHSMGTTTFFVLCSMRPEYNDKVVTMFALAPVAFMSHAKTPLRYLAPFSKDIELILRLFGPGEFLPRNYLMTFILKFACQLTAVEVKMCENDLFVICGHDPEQFNSELMPRILGHTPAGSSTKNMVHYSQEMISGYFRQFDYGKKNNEIIYGSKEPPKYNLSNVIVPVSLHYADNDLLANPKDVLQLSNLLPNVINLNKVEYPRFNHLDFIWSKNVNLYVNDKILTMIDKININGEVPKSLYSISKESETSFDNDIPLTNDILTLFEQEVTRIAKEYINNDFKDTKIDTDKILFNLKLVVKKVLCKINKNFQNQFMVSMTNGSEVSNATDTNERNYIHDENAK